MVKVNDIINKLENFAPPELAAPWDNAGWQVYLGGCEVNKVLIALTPSLEVINQAIEKQCDLIISHHPLLFEKINKINSENSIDLSIIKAIQNNIQIYSAHTNLDITSGGIADEFACLIGLKNLKSIDTTNFVKVGELDQKENLEEFLEKLKQTLDVAKLKVINPNFKNKIKKVALCPGSGGDLINYLSDDIDIYITGDIKYHTAIDIKFTIIDAGHFETERIILPKLKKLLETLELDIFIADENLPWTYF